MGKGWKIKFKRDMSSLVSVGLSHHQAVTVPKDTMTASSRHVTPHSLMSDYGFMCEGTIRLLCYSFCIYSVKHFHFLMQNPLMKKKSLSGWMWICLLFWWHRLNFQLTRGRIKYYIFFQSTFHLYTVIRACAKGSCFCLHERAVTPT